MYFWYDAFGSLCEVLYDDNGTASAYMVVCNSRGDVERLYNADGTLATRYIYDSWGNVISVVDSSNKQITNQNAIGNVNPIRYRGYYLDSETGYYYLQSRYYNPQLGRFLNSDTICDTRTGILGTNMFAYCENNPVNCVDVNGYIKVNQNEKNNTINEYNKYMKENGYYSSCSLDSAIRVDYHVNKNKYGVCELTCDYTMPSSFSTSVHYNAVFLFGNSDAWYNTYHYYSVGADLAEAFGQGFITITKEFWTMITSILLVIICFGLLNTFDNEAQFYLKQYNNSKNSGVYAGYYGVLQTFSKTTFDAIKGTSSTVYIVSH